MKKMLALLLALCVMMSMVACSSNNTDNGSQSSSANQSSESSKTDASGSTGDVYSVKMVMPYILTAPGEAAVQQTEDTFNDYLKNTLGITDMRLELSVVTWADEQTQTPMDLAAKTSYDIVSASFVLSNYVENGYLLPLDDYLDNELKDAVERVEDFMICAKLRGHYYALPSWSGQVIDWKFIYNKEMVDGVVDMEGVDTIDEVLAKVEELKEIYPDEHFLAYPNQLPAIYGMEDHTNLIGSYTATVGESTTIVNYFETEAFKKGCEKAFEVKNKGLCDPEGVTNTFGHDALVYSGSAKGVLMGHSLTNDSVEEMFTNNCEYGATFDSVTFGTSDMVNARFMYGIAYTSENPTMAARMLNLIWTDEFLFNTLGFGTEGIDYEWNEDHTMLLYPEGLGQMTVPYNCIYALAGLGDQRMLWYATGGTSPVDMEYIEKLNEEAWFPPTYGFTPDNANVATQIAAVSNVYNQYYDVLTYGEVDPAEYLPIFLQELKTAGIDDIIAEYQSQLDAWLAENK